MPSHDSLRRSALHPTVPIALVPGPDPRFHLSPSAVARAFFHDCERLLRFRATPKARRAAEGVPPPPREQSPVTAAILERGLAWEEQLVGRLGKRVATARAGRDVPLRDRQFDAPGTIAVLHTLQPGQFLYQGTLLPPAAFYDRLGLDRALVGFRENRPDLLQCVDGPTGRRLLRVLDVKASRALKLTHRIQVALYALQLRDVVAANGVDADVDLELAGVWLTDAEAPELFDLAMIVPHVETFLRHDVPRILGEPEAPASDRSGTRPIAGSEPHWHVHLRCEWCEWFESCRDEAEQRKDLALIPHLPPAARRYLVKQGVTTLPQLGVLLQRNDAEETLAQCATLAGSREKLQRQVEALDREVITPLGGSSLAMPRGENVRVTLTLQAEPVRGRVYAIGVLTQARADRREALGIDGKAKVFVAPSPDDVEETQARALTHLHDVLQRVDAFNAGRPWADQLGLQTYVYDGYELALLVDVLLRGLTDPTIDRVALALFSHFHDAALVHADQHRKVEVPFPVVVLTRVIRQVLALPTRFALRLPDVLARLSAGSERPFVYVPGPLFQAPLSNVMKSDAIFEHWHGAVIGRLRAIEHEIQARLYAATAVVDGIRRHAEAALFAWPPKFRLPEPHGIADPTLSRLAFMAEYESAMGALAAQERRARSRYERVHDGDAVPLRANRRGQLLLDEATSAVIEEDDFTTWLLSRDDAQGDREAMAFPDARYRNRSYGPRLEHAALVRVREATVDRATGATRSIQVEPIAGGLGDEAIRQGGRFLLQPRFTDWNAERVVKHLRALDGERDSPIVGWLTDRTRAAAPRPLPAHVDRELAHLRDDLDLLPSKAQALDDVRRRALTLLWGPPGTGKTHFLAEALLALALAHARARTPFRVLVTAQSHPAIENLLRKLLALRGGGAGGHRVRIDLAKVDTWRLGEVPDGVELVDRDDAHATAGRGAIVVGATMARILKMPPIFDVVVVDEASQLRVPDATVPLSRVAPTGRVVLAGDHLQLPPIVQAAYPEPEPGAPLLHRSVFEAVQRLDAPTVLGGDERPRGGKAPRPITAKLTENFRMNDVLTGFAAAHLYGADYRPATDAVREARLRWAPPRERARGEAEELVRFALDPRFPIALVMLEGVFAARHSPDEAAIVADLAMALREGLRDGGGRRYPDTEAGDAAFFRDGLFVTCPHHAQNHAVRHALGARRAWRSPPFVDTVDKMQGQEAEAVIVSYGVSDPDFALQEAEFIYSRNRLNVAMTRARTKCVVCLPVGLIDGAAEVVENEDAARGLAFMRALRLEAERRGEGRVFRVGEGSSDGGGARARVWRMG